jgi:hypothetical protein
VILANMIIAFGLLAPRLMPRRPLRRWSQVLLKE